MTDIQTPARIDGYKTQARRLRAQLAETGTTINHAQALEMVAQQHGARDWNTLRAIADQPRPLTVGDRVEGRYMDQRFSGYVHGLLRMGPAGHRRVTLQFDQPVDVVKFDSFSSFRQRVSAVIDPMGRGLEKGSDGQPHLIIHSAG